MKINEDLIQSGYKNKTTVESPHSKLCSKMQESIGAAVASVHFRFIYVFVFSFFLFTSFVSLSVPLEMFRQ